jgi:hypothetical protein
MLDTIFTDYQYTQSDLEYEKLHGMMKHIREVRDEVAEMKRQKILA